MCELTDRLDQIEQKLDKLLSAMNASKVLLDTEGAAEFLGYKVSSIRTMTAQNLIPCSRPLGGRVIYHRDDLERFAMRRRNKASYEIEQMADDYVSNKPAPEARP